MNLRACMFILPFLLAFGCKDHSTKSATITMETPAVEKQRHAAPTFEDLKGNPIELSDFKGKRILLNFWATWCRPCIEEMPALSRAQELLKNDNYVFLLASDQSVEKIQAFVDKKKFDLTFIRFNGAFAEIGVNALPTTFFYNELGKQVLRIEGMTDCDSEAAIERFKKLK